MLGQPSGYPLRGVSVAESGSTGGESTATSGIDLDDGGRGARSLPTPKVKTYRTPLVRVPTPVRSSLPG
jgi:hypothetical protein